MTPNDLEEYLQVLIRNDVGAATVKLGSGVEIHVSFMPKFELPKGSEVTPGGWKSPQHLDDPEALRDDREYKGDLPS